MTKKQAFQRYTRLSNFFSFATGVLLVLTISFIMRDSYIIYGIFSFLGVTTSWVSRACRHKAFSYVFDCLPPV